MAYEEYNDLLIKAQHENSEYRVFTFDIIGSKNMSKYDRYIAQYDIIFLIERVYADIKELEKTLNIEILIKEPGFGSFFDTNIQNDFSYRYEPFLFGDTIGLTIYNGSVDPLIIYEIFDYNKEEMNLKYDFHKCNLLYQTNDYHEGNTKYFRGYAIHAAEELHKRKNDEIRNSINDRNIVDNEEIKRYMYIVKTNHQKAINNAINLLSTHNENFLAGIMDKRGNYIIKDLYIKEKYKKLLKIDNNE